MIVWAFKLDTSLLSDVCADENIRRPWILGAYSQGTDGWTSSYSLRKPENTTSRGLSSTFVVLHMCVEGTECVLLANGCTAGW